MSESLEAPLFPSLSANGSVSTNQVAIGSFPPTQFDAWRVTADVAWELDFWGRTRRGIEAANADLASDRGEPACGGALPGERRSALLSVTGGARPGADALGANAGLAHRHAGAGPAADSARD